MTSSAVLPGEIYIISSARARRRRWRGSPRASG